MNIKGLLIVLALLLGAVVVYMVTKGSGKESPVQTGSPAKLAHTQSPPSPTTAPAQTAGTRHVPAHYQAPPASAELRPVLAASQFTGKAREAYAAVKEIPATIAQMPCYCHCDRGMGHKSLHSCFEDDHAAHCAVCVDEALMAYRLQKEGLSATEIRTRIIAKFAEPGS
jgi:Protein of unknown function with PCYCGC motif